MKKSFQVVGMTCAACAQSISSYLEAQKGIDKALVNLTQHKVLISYDEQIIHIEQLQFWVKELGYELLLEGSKKNFHAEQHKFKRSLRIKLLIAALFSLPVFIWSMFFMHSWIYEPYALFALSLPVILYSGSYFYVGAFKLAKKGKTNMDTLVVLSTSLAFLFSSANTFFPQYIIQLGLEPHLYYESAVVIITLILFGKFIEERAKDKTAQAIKELAALKSDLVEVEYNGEIKEFQVGEVTPGMIMVIQPGKEIPLDGKVKRGNSMVNEAHITGESIPVLKERKSLVFAGSINLSETLKILVTHDEQNSFLSQLVGMVEQALFSKAKIEELTDRISAIFVPVIIFVAFLAMLLWYFIGDADFPFSLWIAVSVLIVACPCALGLATPTAMSVGMGKAAQQGILIKNANSLEKAEHIDVVLLDKTGTITIGQPIVEYHKTRSEFKTYQSLFKSAFKASHHPLAKAITHAEFWKDLELNEEVEIKEVTGKGVVFEIDHKEMMFGSYHFLQEYKVSIPNELEDEKVYRSNGSAMVYAFSKNELFAYFSLTDAIKPGAVSFIKDLKERNIEAELWSGDLIPAVNKVARSLDIQTFKGNCTPQDKLERIKELQKAGKKVAMIGDGSNDAPALAMADLSIAMAKGTDLARHTAQITLMHKDLNNLIKAFDLAKDIQKTIKQNLFWAFIYNILMIPIAAGALYPLFGFLLNPMIAGGAMSLSSISVLLNSLKLKYK